MQRLTLPTLAIALVVILLAVSGADAVMADYPSGQGETHIGTPEEVVREVAAVLGLSDAETQTALGALNTQAPSPSPGAPVPDGAQQGSEAQDEDDARAGWAVPVAGVVILAVVGLIAVIFSKAGKR